MMIQPARQIFWRFLLFSTLLFVLLAGWNLIDLGGRLNVDIPSRPSWVAVLSSLGLFAGLLILGLIISFSNRQNAVWELLEIPHRLPRTAGLVLSLTGLIGFSVVTWLGGFQKLFGGEEWVRIFIFWMFSLTGMWGIKSFRQGTNWMTALITIILLQSTLHLLISYWSLVTSYPFAMGWSETSRYYFPSLFLSETIYGQKYPLPILHPTLHLLLTPPYLIHAPLWAHRLWQVAIRYILIAAVVPVMVKRVSIQEKAYRWLIALWIFLYLFMIPIYFHLTIPTILILFGFTLHDDRRNWFVILLASAWCGWSRVNWYPVSALIATVLYVLETPIKGKNTWQYLWKPALWGIVGTLTAFTFQKFYIVISGVENSNYFYTSIASDLLWYRLFPNATYPPGMILAAFMASLALFIVLYLAIQGNKGAFHPVRIFLLIASLIVLFVGGLLVSLKIGGGADLHNMDAYFVMLLISALHLTFARYERDDNLSVRPIQLQWWLVIALLIEPVWANIQSNIKFVTYDSQRTDSVLADIQAQVDQVNAKGGEILFITQRHLVSMDMVHGVTLIPEYEREDLMEMAMGNNTEYLNKFQSDIENQHFAMIVVNPLRYFVMTNRRSFAEENNAWVINVAKVILCNYQAKKVFPTDDIALYVPQTGERHCP